MNTFKIFAGIIIAIGLVQYANLAFAEEEYWKYKNEMRYGQPMRDNIVDRHYKRYQLESNHGYRYNYKDRNSHVYRNPSVYRHQTGSDYVHSRGKNHFRSYNHDRDDIYGIFGFHLDSED
jgi:hypothetical protein